MKAWSFSRYDTHSKCPYRAKLQYVDGHTVPSGPHADRGTMLHENAQGWVRGEHDDLHQDLHHFAAELARLKSLYAAGTVFIEDEWAWTHSFAQQADWRSDDAWVRMKVDFGVHLSPTHLLIVDLKSGKKSGNEIKHTEQGQLYTVGGMLKYPNVEKVDVEFWYADQNDTMDSHYTAQQAATFLPRWIDKGLKVTSGVYPPRPNLFSCKWCPFRQVEDGGNGVCEHAVKIIKKPKSKGPTTAHGFFDFGIK
jgi:hypothetical protein